MRRSYLQTAVAAYRAGAQSYLAYLPEEAASWKARWEKARQNIGLNGILIRIPQYYYNLICK